MKQFSNFTFWGSNQLSVIVLQKLLDAGMRPQLVITLPDSKQGRKQELSPTPLKKFALEQNLNVLTPTSLKDALELTVGLPGFRPELGAVAAYGKIIPPEILALFPKGVVNLHPSLLPKLRGPSPVQTAILQGEKQTGVSIILLDQQLDHGPILAQVKVEIGADEYFAELLLRLAELGGRLLAETIRKWLEDQIVPQPQNDSQATFTKKLSWTDGKIDLNKSAREIYNQIRALSYEPGCWLGINSGTGNNELRIMKVIKAKPLNSQFVIHNSNLGLQELDKQLILKCKNGVLLLEQVQPQGKRVMAGKEFLAGYGKLLLGAGL